MARRVVLVTGAARGIGRGIAADLGRDHDVALTWQSTDPGPLLAERPFFFPIQSAFVTGEILTVSGGYRLWARPRGRRGNIPARAAASYPGSAKCR